ncbi:tail fiber assembly protein [Pseudodesulfovibrio piezophilus]|uniref:Phage tail assembly chaperone-like domain-containing protein n=1 Tax=Pseudodesulfovibrio piezophilus (strain DSM 21447 / JCM 15486 / C1TLV30) TaxID=1322246 RepID=M1WRL8_PSEP2|nr:tail fiber assembly protein [Pseudodesulfovibrio piezophilus]CCH49639.1 conserved protein of unknown function [Pseudodesulfovibrio piezophilus C1TLV30]
MFRYHDGHFKTTPPAVVTFRGYTRRFGDLNRTEWDEAGYNEAFPITRKPYTTYQTRWVKGEDLIYREEILATTTDEEAQSADKAVLTRKKRDRLLAQSDWTQLVDSCLDTEAMVLWQSYRQALRDIPQQEGFPSFIEWPEQPETE